MIRTVFFDWNGTLLADTALRYHLTNASLNFLGRPKLSRTDYHKHHTIPISQFYKNINVPDDVMAAKGKAERESFHKGYEAGALKTHTRQGTRAMLNALHERGIQRVILSNHTVKGIEVQLNRLGLGQFFDEILANDNIHTSAKQGKRGLLEEHLHRHHLNPGEAAIIGDTIEEVHIGRELGLKTVAITGGVHSRTRLAAEHPDAIISRLDKLNAVLEDFA